jgi:hypothetical protein
MKNSDAARRTDIRYDRLRRIVIYSYGHSARAWSRWRLGGCKFRKVMGPIEMTGEYVEFMYGVLMLAGRARDDDYTFFADAKNRR